MTETLEAVGTATPRIDLMTYNTDSEENGSRSADGWWSSDTYDSMGRVLSSTDPYGNQVLHVYDLDGEEIATRDQLGRWSKSVYNSRGWLTQSIDALGNTTTTGYDAAGNVTSTTDALSHSWTTIYDALNRATQQTDPLNHSSTTAFDTVGNVSTVTDALNNITKYAYDVLNRRTSETDAFGSSVARTLSTTYDNVGNALTQTDGINTSSFAYDNDNRRTSSTDGLNHSSSETFDLDSNVASTTDALNKTTTFAYDTLNEENKTTDPLNHVTSSLDDADGNTVETLDALNQPTIQVVDELDRPIDTIDARTGQTLKAYDAVGNLTSLTDPAGNTTRWIYDGDNRQVVAIDPLGARTVTGYDIAGRKTQVTDRNGRQRVFGYDNANRLLSETWKSAAGVTLDTLNYTYDSNNNLLTAGNGNGTYTRTYDPLNRMATEQNPFAITLTFGYNSADDRTSVVDSLGGTVNSTYDAAHRLTARSYVTGGATQLTMALGYDNRNELTSETRSDLVSGTLTTVGTSTLGYDDAGRLTSLQHKNGGGTNLANYGYTYDSADRLSSETLNGGTATNYTYDSTNQLTNDGTSNYTYDLNGNRTISGYVTGSDNRLTTDGVWTYSYDSEGNLTKKTKGANAETWYYTYDNWNHMTSAVQQQTDGGTVLMSATYKYDVFGNRIEKDVTQNNTTTVTRFAYDQGNIWADLNSSNQLLTRRLFLASADSEFVRISAAGAVAWYLPDHLGSIRDITDNTGSVIDHLNYTVYGGIASETNTANGDQYKYAGYQFNSEQSDYYDNAREYRQDIGRFGSQDPSGLTPDADPYRYAGNDPTNATDSGGLESIPLYGKGTKPDYKMVTQGGINDCWFLAALIGLAKRDPGAIKSMITENENGTLTVNFPGKDPVTIERPDSDKDTPKGTWWSGTRNDNEDNGIWVRVLEKAYGELLANEKKKGDDPHRAFEMMNGQFSGVDRGIRALSPNDSNVYLTDGTSRAKIRKRIQTAVKDKRIITASTFSLNPRERYLGMTHRPVMFGTDFVNLVRDHVYSVLDYDPAADKVLLCNPHGHGEPEIWNYKKKEWVVADGVDDGFFWMKLEDFCTYFSFYAIEKSD